MAAKPWPLTETLAVVAFTNRALDLKSSTPVQFFQLAALACVIASEDNSAQPATAALVMIFISGFPK